MLRIPPLPAVPASLFGCGEWSAFSAILDLAAGFRRWKSRNPFLVNSTSSISAGFRRFGFVFSIRVNLVAHHPQVYAMIVKFREY